MLILVKMSGNQNILLVENVWKSGNFLWKTCGKPPLVINRYLYPVENLASFPHFFHRQRRAERLAKWRFFSSFPHFHRPYYY